MTREKVSAIVFSILMLTSIAGSSIVFAGITAGAESDAPLTSETNISPAYTAADRFADSAQVDISPSNLPGSGTENDPYRISNASELQAMEDDLGAHYILDSNIDASTTSLWNNGSGFDPIGDHDLSDKNRFNGSLNGSGHTIRGLSIARPDTSRVGLFAKTGESAEITNVSLTQLSIRGESTGGGVVGDNRGTIQEVTVSGNITMRSRAGGIAGQSEGIIRNVAASGRVAAQGDETGRNAGGIVGRLGFRNDDSSIRNVSVSADVTGRLRVGGVVGLLSGGTVRAAKASGSVTGGDRVGGLIGEDGSGGIDRVQNAFAVGAVSGDPQAEDIGGVVGDGGGEMANVYWNTVSTEQSTSGIGYSPPSGTFIPLTTSEMQGATAESNMSRLDFENNWTTTSSYPKLRTVSAPDPPRSQAPPASVTFTDQTVLNGSATVTIDQAQLGNTTILGDPFVVVLHKTNDSSYEDGIGAKIGESAVFSSGVQQNITVNISDTLDDGHDTASLTQSQSLVAMLHHANTSDSGAITHAEPITRNGNAVTDRASVSVTSGDNGGGTANATLSTIDTVSAPGTNVTVTFNLTNQRANKGFILDTNWNESAIHIINQSSDGGVWNANETKWYWRTIESNSTVTASLTVQLPESASPGTEYTISAEALTVDGVVATTNATTSTGLSLDEAIDTNNNGEIDDLEILQATEYWRTEATVPQTGGKTIGDFQLLELIETWRLNREV